MVSAKVRCGNCDVPSYKQLEPNKMYEVLLLDFMYKGGDGYTMFKNLPYINLSKYLKNSSIH